MSRPAQLLASDRLATPKLAQQFRGARDLEDWIRHADMRGFANEALDQ